MSRPTADPDPESRAAHRELVNRLEQTIDELPQALRSVFVLRELEGMSTRETAEVLGVSEDAVKTRLHRAKEALAEKMGLWRSDATTAFPFPATRCNRVVAAVMERLRAIAGP